MFQTHEGKLEEVENTLGRPPTPSAISKAKEPVETTGTCLDATERPSHMIEPFPNVEVI